MVGREEIRTKLSARSTRLGDRAGMRLLVISVAIVLSCRAQGPVLRESQNRSLGVWTRSTPRVSNKADWSLRIATEGL